MLTRACAFKIETLQAIHDIHLSESAQIYALVVGRNTLTITDNTGIMTFYNTTYISVEDELEDEVDPVID